MASALASSRGLILAFFALGFLVLACHLGQETTEENSLSFSKRYDSLARYDTVVIEVKDPDGKSLGIIYKGKPVAAGDLDKLIVPGWDGGPIDIFISGYMKSQVGPVFEEKKRYNGATNKTESTLVIVYPNPTITAGTGLAIQLSVGQRVPLPQVITHPENLSEPGLRWASDNPGIAAVDGIQLAGISDGSANLTVTLGKDSTQKIVFVVRVGSGVIAPSRLILDRDTLYLPVHGWSGSFAVSVEPPLADPDVVWRLSDSSIAAQRTDGAFLGLARGATKVWVSSKLKPEITDSAWIVAFEQVPVASVRFLVDSLALFLGGAPESLQVEVLPLHLANPDVVFSLSDSTKASLSGYTLTPKAVGSFTLTVKSAEDPTKSAQIPVFVREPAHIDGVQAADSAITLILGGPGRTLTAKVLPDNAPQGLRWKSLSPTVVSADAQTGAIAPLQSGFARIVATSVVDSAKRDTVAVSVKVDAPRLTITGDSVVSIGANEVFHVNAAQEFGQVVFFQWDTDGNGTWDDSLAGPWTGASVDLPAVTVKYDKAGPVTARFRVRDSEGNLASGSYTLRVAGSAAVSIDSPKDNSYTNQKHILVAWSVNGVPQDSLKSQDLTVGANVISRTARDQAGKSFTATITVTLDTIAPAKPVVSGSSPTNVKPKWTWSSGGSGGSGEYRFRLGDATFPADAATTHDSTYILAADPVSGTTYTLYVEERDLAGNWSVPTSFPIRFDVTAPVVAITAPQASGIYYTSAASVILSGTASGPVAVSQVNYKVGSGASARATLTAGTWTTLAIPLTEGSSVAVTVTAVDQAGNTGEAVLNVMMDATAPAAPVLTTGPTEIGVVKSEFAWTAGTDGASGSGLNGHYRYSVNGGAWKDTTAALLTNLPLIEGSNVFAVQEQDRALLWSASATRSIRVDTSGPVITLTSHTNPANVASLNITLSGQVKDTGTAVAAMTISGQQSGSGTITVTSGTWTSAALTLKSGANLLLLTATDRIGNVRTLSVTVIASVPAPLVQITSPNDDLTLTTATSILVAWSIDGVAQTPKSFVLNEGVNSLIVSSSPNVSGNFGSDTVKVTKDATPPNAPTWVSTTASPTNGTATWKWASGNDNTGGAGVRTPPSFEYSLNGGTTWTPTSSTQYQATAAGSYTLIVQEQDKAGNWSLSSSPKTIVVDLTPPSVKITWPKDSLYVTNTKSTSITIHYSVDNGADQTASCTLATNNSKTCVVSSTDAANNVGQDQVIVWSRPNAVFVTVNGAGSLDGSDWSNAMDSAGFRASIATATYAYHDFWVSTGNYTAPDVFAPTVSVNILAGFNAATHPIDTTGRNKTATVFSPFFIDFGSVTVSLNGGSLPRIGAYDATVVLTDVQIIAGANASNGLYFPDPASDVTANNLTIQNIAYDDCAIVAGGNFVMNGGRLTGLSGSREMLQIYGKGYLNRPLVIGAGVSPVVRLGAGATLNIQTGLAIDCSDKFVNKDEGSVCSVP